MNIHQIIGTRRSVREFLDQEIPAEVLTRILNSARLAPSGRNRQVTRLIVVSDQKLKDALVPLCENQEFIATAPYIVVGVGKRFEANRGQFMGEMSFLLDVGIAFDHFVLAAWAEGLGTCWIGAYANEPVKELLEIPEGWEVVALTPLGYPQKPNTELTSDRISLEEYVHKEKWNREA